MTTIMLRWLTGPMTPATLWPPYRILMGATAITVLAGARMLKLPPGLPVVPVTAGVVEGSRLYYGRSAPGGSHCWSR